MRTQPQQTKRVARKELEELRAWFHELGRAHTLARRFSALPKRTSKTRTRIIKEVEAFDWPFRDRESFIRRALQEKLFTHRPPDAANPPLLIVYEELQAKAFATAEYAIGTGNIQQFRQVFFVFGFDLLRYEGILAWFESLHSMAPIDEQRRQLFRELCQAMTWMGGGRFPKESSSDKRDRKREADRNRAHKKNVQKYYKEAVDLYQIRKKGRSHKGALKSLAIQIARTEFSKETKAKEEACLRFLGYVEKDLSTIQS